MNFPDVKSREEFLEFVAALIEDYRRDGDSWENVSIPEFLEAILAWVKDSDLLASQDAWKAVSQMLYAGSRYE
jgi:hypothetical protein